jgi:hypothetical protein
VDWLAPTGKIDDAEAPHAEADARRDVNAFVVRTTMADDVAHPVHEVEGAVQALLAYGHAVTLVVIDESGYSTHDCFSCAMHG